MSSRSRKRARDAKYAIGVDLAADVDTTVVTSYFDGVYTIEQVIRADRERMETERIVDEIADAFRRDLSELRRQMFGPKVIDGSAVEVIPEERRLDAGGSEP